MPPRRSATEDTPVPDRRRPAWWRRERRLRQLGIGVPLALCGLLVLALVGFEAGPEALAVGVALALVPVPALIGLFRWVDGVVPKPWRHLAFAFAWGACAATLLALAASGLLLWWLTGDGDAARLTPAAASTLELTVVAPVVEETAKAVAVLLLFLHRPRAFDGILAGVAAAGVTATGFAFAENVLYLAAAYAEDRLVGAHAVDSATAATFVVRIVLAPLAHPLFTAVVGVAFGLAAALPARRRAWRRALPPLGLAAAVGLHSVWNAAVTMSLGGFVAVYALLMFPVFALLCWLSISARQRALRTVRETLPRYARAGWLDAAEPAALGSPDCRALSRQLARRAHGAAGVRAVTGYQAAATSLALLRRRADLGTAGPDFATRERELLAGLWHHRRLAGPATVAAGLDALELDPAEPDLAEPDPAEFGAGDCGAGDLRAGEPEARELGAGELEVAERVAGWPGAATGNAATPDGAWGAAEPGAVASDAGADAVRGEAGPGPAAGRGADAPELVPVPDDGPHPGVGAGPGAPAAAVHQRLRWPARGR